MASVHDVASYILTKQNHMTAMKLQKLCYYSKAWHLVWAEESLFPETFEAWANGPVCPELYHAHRGCFIVDDEPKGDSEKLTDDQRDSIDVVMEHYGKMSAYQLSALTHTEAPWKDARGDLPSGARSNAPISDSAMAEYYESLIAAA